MRRSFLLVAWALVACSRSSPPEPVRAAPIDSPADAAPTTHAFKRPREASAEVAVLTNASPGAIAKLTARDALAASLGLETCGDAAACDAVRAFVNDAKRFDVAVHPASEWIVPQGDALKAATEGLSNAERAKIASMPTAIVVTAHGAALPDQLPARAMFAAAASLAKSLGAYVHDDILERIEQAPAFAKHAIVEPLGARVLRGDRFVVRADEEADAGTARMVTLGLGRFGAPDVDMESIPSRAVGSMSSVLDAIAGKLVLGVREAPFAFDDARPHVKVDVVPAPIHEGDRDNVIVRVLVEGVAPPR